MDISFSFPLITWSPNVPCPAFLTNGMMMMYFSMMVVVVDSEVIIRDVSNGMVQGTETLQRQMWQYF
jgi:hypothetical protein